MAKVLIIYDSLYGNTRSIAESLHGLLSDAMLDVSLVSVKEISIEDMNRYDAFVIGSPTHYWNPSRDIIKLLEEMGRSRIREKIGFIFSTRFKGTLLGSAGNHIFTCLKILHFSVQLPWVDFHVEDVKGPIVDDKDQKCRMFADKISTIILALSKQRHSEENALA